MYRRIRFTRTSVLALMSAAALVNACSSATPTPPQETAIVDYVFSPSSPATLKHGEYVSVDISYVSGHPTPLRMWAQIEYDGPITEGTLGYCPSAAVVAKEGVEERCFRVEDAYVNGVPASLHVDTVELKIVDQEQTVELVREMVAVDYTWEP